MKRYVCLRYLTLPAMLLGLSLSLQTPGLSNGGHQHPGAAAPAPLAVGAPIFIPKESQFLLGIRTAVATVRMVAQRISTLGKVVSKPQNVAEVFAPHAGRIVSGGAGIPQIGQWVERGQVLAAVEQILSAPERLSVKTELAKLEGELMQARLEVRLAEQEVRLAEQEARLTRKNLERLRNLSAVVAKKEIPQAELAHQQAQNKVIRARGEVQRARSHRDQLLRQRSYYQDLNTPGESRIGRYPLSAPISGIITEAHATLGEQVGPERGLFEIIDPRTVWVESNIYEADLPLVERVRSATITTAAYPGLVRTGRLISLSPKIDEQTRTARALFEVPNPGTRLRIGMFVTPEVATRQRVKRVTVPAAALYEKGEKAWIFVHTSAETFQQRPVTAGEKVQDLVVVRGGIKAGERVVVQGTHQLFAAAATGTAPSPPARKKG